MTQTDPHTPSAGQPPENREEINVTGEQEDTVMRQVPARQ